MKEWNTLATDEQQEILTNAEACVREHRDHVRRLMDSEGSAAFPPSASDMWHPDRWKPSHWRWWLSLDDPRASAQIRFALVSYERLRSWTRNPIATAIDKAGTSYRPAPLPTAAIVTFLVQAAAVLLGLWTFAEAAVCFPIATVGALYVIRWTLNAEAREDRERLVRAVEDRAARDAFAELLAVLRSLQPPTEGARSVLDAVVAGKTPPEDYDVRAVFSEAARYLQHAFMALARTQ